jgi:spore maturation protein CgeB
MAKRILIVGETDNHCLEMSYYEAFLALGCEVLLFDTKKMVEKYARPGKWAYRFHLFFTVESWLRKANKELAEMVLKEKPDIVLAFTGAQVLPGTFAYIKSVLPATIAWYWADPLPNMNRYIHNSLALTDVVASYSSSSLEAFRLMGAKKTCWIPFAGDVKAHFEPAAEKIQYTYDVNFVGSWRPEREAALRVIYESFEGLKLKVTGPYWNRCSFKPLQRMAGTEPLYGKAFTDIVQDSLLSLNVMDNTNYPAVNMRFFEIFSSGGAQLCSAGPEMEPIFKDREHLLYFSDKDRLVEQVKYALANKKEIEAMKIRAQGILLKEHMYKQRAEALLAAIEKK